MRASNSVQVLFTLVVLIPSHNAFAADVTAAWSGFSLWSDATSWSSDPDIPNNDGTTTYDVVISTGTVTADVPHVVVDGLTLDGGLIRGTENITMTTTGSWTEQRIFESAGITVDAGATFDISGNRPKSLQDQTSLTVRGTANLSGSGVLRSAGSGSSDAAIDIEALGVFDLQSDANIVGEFGAGPYRKGTLTNAGTFKKSAGSGTSVIDGNWDVLNTGDLLVESGTLRFQNFTHGNTFRNDGVATVQAGALEIGNGSSTGSFNVQAGTTLTVTSTLSGQQVFDAALISNDGAFVLAGNSQFTNGASYTGTGGVEISGGSLAGDSVLTFPSLQWSGGRIDATGGIVIPAGGQAAVSGNDTKQLGDGARLTIDGTANITSSKNIDALAATAQPAEIRISATGVLDFQSDAGLSDGQSGFNKSRAGVLMVDGTLQKTAGTSSTISTNWSVINNGTVEVQTGTLALDGTVSGSGSYPGSGNVAFNGSFSPGDSPAAIDFAGDVQFGSSSSLLVELGGAQPGSQYDVLDIEGASDLNGLLQVSLVDAFEPVLGDTFEILHAETGLTGAFSATALPALSDNLLGWSILYDENAVSLEVVSLESAAADFNEDTVVDGADLLAWETNFGAGSATKAMGDSDVDEDVDGVDFLTWQRQYTGSPQTAILVTAVPEPSGIVMLLVGLANCLMLPRRCRAQSPLLT